MDVFSLASMILLGLFIPMLISFLPLSLATFVTTLTSDLRISLVNRRTSNVSLSAKASAVLDVTELQTANSISDPAYKDAVQRIQFLNVPVPENVSTSGMVSVSYIHWKSEKPTRTLPILLIPGFDSSLLEFRRLGPQLASEGIEVYAVDLLGFGFTQFENIQDFSANAKVTTLSNFWKALHAATTEDDISYSRNFVVAGASLGGAAAIELAAIATRSINNPVKGMVLIDAQGFVDGVGPMANLPGPIAKLGIQVLKSEPLRNSANQMSYYDKETFATDDALKVGRLHCLRPGWENAMLNYMLSGGFSPSAKIGLCDMPTLVLWGREDGILKGEEFATKFISELPNARLSWIEQCGHVPHLEQPLVTAQEIARFLKSDEFSNELQAATSNFSLSDMISWIQKTTSDIQLPIRLFNNGV